MRSSILGAITSSVVCVISKSGQEESARGRSAGSQFAREPLVSRFSARFSGRFSILPKPNSLTDKRSTGRNHPKSGRGQSTQKGGSDPPFWAALRPRPSGLRGSLPPFAAYTRGTRRLAPERFRLHHPAEALFCSAQWPLPLGGWNPRSRSGHEPHPTLPRSSLLFSPVAPATGWVQMCSLLSRSGGPPRWAGFIPPAMSFRTPHLAPGFEAGASTAEKSAQGAG